MMWQDLWAAVALVFVIEGLMPFLNPTGLRKTLYTISDMDDKILRVLGFSSMLLGVILLYLVRNFYI